MNQATNIMNRVNKMLSGNFENEGWDGLDNKKNPQDVYDAQMQNFTNAQVIAAPFRTPEGRRCLDALRQSTIFAATWDAETDDILTGIAKGFAREGQNSLIRHIDRCIQIVDNGPPRPPTTPVDQQGKQEI